MATKGTVIVTGGSQGIGAAIVQAFLDRGYSVVATSRKITQAGLGPSPNFAIDTLVNNAGIFMAKPFTDYTIDDFRALVATNLEGYLYITQYTVKQMLAQKAGGSVV